MVDKWVVDNTIKDKSILKVEREIQEKHNSPNNIEPLNIINAESPPNKVQHSPLMKLDLVENITKSNSDIAVKSYWQ